MSDLINGDRVRQGNIGAVTPGPVPPSGFVGTAGSGRGQEIEVLSFNGDEFDASNVTIAMSCINIGNDTGVGPMVGIAEFGSGNGQIQRVEFDLPSSGATPASPITPSGGCIFTIPMSSVSIKTRNDANFIPPQGNAVLGASASGCLVTASLGVGTKPGGDTGLFRTVYQVVSTPGAGLAGAGGFVNVPIPPFAKTARVLRFDAARTIQVEFTGNPLDIDGPYNFSANVPASTFTIPGGSLFVTVTNTTAGAGNTIDRLAVLFGLSL